jgi:hypothetical protein
MSKFPSPFGKPKKIGTPVSAKETREEGKARADAGLALQKFGEKGPLAPKKTPAKAPPGGYKGGMSGQQYEGEVLKDYSSMKPKLATKDKILNPIKKAVGLPGKPATMVQKKPGSK